MQHQNIDSNQAVHLSYNYLTNTYASIQTSKSQKKMPLLDFI